MSASIHLGLTTDEKRAAIASYCASNSIKRIYIISPPKMDAPTVEIGGLVHQEVVAWANVIEYAFFYRLLTDIDKNTLVVINESLRDQNRYLLTYNCIRNYLTMTPHVMVMQYLPIIADRSDYMTLFDFATRSQWKRERFSRDVISRSSVATGRRIDVRFNRVDVPTSSKTKETYAAERERLFAEIGGTKDPHTIPRNLLMVSGRDKLAFAGDGLMSGHRRFIGRNGRFGSKIDMSTFKDVLSDGGMPYTVFELPHNHLDMIDFLTLTRQASVDVMVADTKADEWYWQRYQNWAEELSCAYSAIL